MKPFLLLAFFTLSGCVVKTYGTPIETLESPEATMAYTELVALDAKLQILAEEVTESDRISRIEATRRILKKARRWDPDAQKDLKIYVEAIIKIEQEYRSEFLGGGIILGTSQVEQVEDEIYSIKPVDREIDNPEIEPDIVITDIEDVQNNEPEVIDSGEPEIQETDPVILQEEAIQKIKLALSEKRYEDALDLITDAPIKNQDILSLADEASDGYVRQERERAGHKFLEARKLTGNEKLMLLEEVRDILQQILVEFPDSTYVEAVRRNLTLVEKEISEIKVD